MGIAAIVIGVGIAFYQALVLDDMPGFFPFVLALGGVLSLVLKP